MHWTINLMCAVLLTTFTGSCMLAVWHLIGRVLEKMGYLDVQYRILQAVLLFFLIPAVYLVMKYLDEQNRLGNGTIFLPTPRILFVSRVFFLLWLLGVVLMSARYAREIREMHRCYHDKISCDRRTQACFDGICQELGIAEGKVKLFQSYRATVSEFTGLFHPMVVLPVKDYTEKELRVMFVHELSHYRQKDIWMKYVLMLVLITQFFNPFVWWLYLLLQRFSEYACDDKTRAKIGEEKTYYKVIVKMSCNRGKWESFFTARLVEEGHEVLERIKRMEKNKKNRKRGTGIAAFICVAMLLSGSCMVYASAEGMAEAYEWLYVQTVKDEQEENLITELMEYEDSGAENGIVEIEEEVDQMSRAVSSFNWSVGGHVMKKTSTFNASSGGNISVTIYITPTNKTVSVGIIEPNGMRRYVNGNDYITHKFVLDQTGSYRVFVENKNDGAVEVEGSYIVR
ncbi:M56 family metallopeptidase [Fusibacillus kribbianus]|uniref:M56 family metallopeptidase n=1 Tax=Fusibacillus kribbianus TaxID=3044208 RepID=A0AAP4BAH1_9FIRM|nr:M56 family metallopeptidase [Ruminococcus sp. YH-rum2234]MDI9242070.1 M56 family metallopeptidase [Ruminococcus sp. YH-rum2234]